MRKYLVIFALLAQVWLNAGERSAPFVGFELATGNATMKMGALGVDVMSLKGTMAGFGGKIGYTYFWSETGYASWGARMYVGVNYLENVSKLSGPSAEALGTSGTIKFDSLVYSVNADVIWNFIEGEESAYGAFIGVGVGWANYKVDMYGSTEKIGALHSDAKVGLRAKAWNNVVDLFVTIPFIEATKSVNYGTGIPIDYKAKQDYIITLSYSFAF